MRTPFCGKPACHPPTMADDQPDIRIALRRRRRAVVLTQEEAATLLGVQRLVYTRMENGPRRISWSELAALCAVLNCTISDLVHDESTAACITRATDILGGKAMISEREMDGNAAGVRDTETGALVRPPFERMLKLFKFDHLPEHLQAVSKPFSDLAHHLVEIVPAGPERTVALRKLLESKDAAVRAVAIPE